MCWNIIKEMAWKTSGKKNCESHKIHYKSDLPSSPLLLDLMLL